jgi:hypothetical protein
MKELRSRASTIEFIRKYSIFKYLNTYHLPDETGYTYHREIVRGILKKHFPIYAKRIELWEVLHSLKIIEPKEDNR